MRSWYAILFALLLTLNTSAYARTLEGINLPDKIHAAGETLVLNGAGVRTATIFGIRVYVMGLYLAEKAQTPEAIIQQTTAKRIYMQFMRSVSASKLRGAWEDGIKTNVGTDPEVLKHLESFNSKMIDVEEGDTFTLTLQGTQSQLSINGNDVLTIDSAAFQKALLLIWLGKEPPNESLKEGLLGK